MAKKRRGQSAAFMRSINPFLRRKSSNSIKRGAKNVKRRSRSRRSSRRYSSNGGLKPMNVLIGGGIYGAARAKLSNALTPITSKIPLGTIADEAVLFGLGYYANRQFKDKTLKSVAMAAMAVEAARIGEAVIEGSAFNTSSNGASVSGLATLG